MSNLSGLESPWQCPHGRPTMRHLLDFDKFKNQSFVAIGHTNHRGKLKSQITEEQCNLSDCCSDKEEEDDIEENLHKNYKTDPMEFLPDHVLFKILRHLDAKSLYKSMMVSTLWKSTVQNKYLDYG